MRGKGFILASSMVILTMTMAACGGSANSTPTSSTGATSATEAAGSTSSALTGTNTTSSTLTGTSAVTGTQAVTSSSAVTGTQVATATTATTAVTGTAEAAPALRTADQAALAATGGKKIGGSVTVLATWGGSEQDAFMAMIKPFEDATGVNVQYEGTRDLNAVLTTRVSAGNPPDLAGLPGPGQMAQFAQQGKLVDLSTFIDMNAYNQQYASSWKDLGTVNGKLVGIFIKASVKGLVWYDPKVWQAKGFQVPKTYNDLIALSKQMASSGTAPWCVGLESGAASGWPGTDWLEDIVLRQDGTSVYDQWYQGKLAWTSPQIKQAWQTWGQIVSDPKMVYGGVNSMLTTNFGQAGNPLFTNPPGCYMQHEANFITGFYSTTNPSLVAGVDYNFFQFPGFGNGNDNNLEVAGDLFGMFKDTPQARALIQYLTTPEAQAIWVKRGGALSPNKLVPMSTYPDKISQQLAQLMISASTVRFDASDLMPNAMTNAFYKAILDYVQNPSNLDSILTTLDNTRKTAYK